MGHFNFSSSSMNEVMMQEIQSYGYADDFNAIARNQNDMNKATETIQKWLETSKLKLKTKKSHTLNIKGSIKAKIREKDVEPVSLYVIWDLLYSKA